MLTGFTIADMVRFLNLRKRVKTSTVLILGSRVGGLFRSDELYETMKFFADPSFNDLPNIERFAECYRLLMRPTSGFSVTDIDTVLTQSLRDVHFTDTDICLAELVKSEVFDIILTCTMDNILERALEYVGLRELRDFEVFSLHPGIAKRRLRFNKNMHCHIIKIFGGLTARDYTMKRTRHFSRNPDIRQHLESFLGEDLMIVGLDPVWDAEIYDIFPTEGDSFWYINEETLSEDSVLYSVADVRNGRTFIGEEASYERFLRHLHRAFFSTNMLGQDGILLDNQAASGGEGNQGKDTVPDLDNKRDDGDGHSESVAAKKALSVFISSVSQDDTLLRALLAHMAALKHENIVDTWYSHKILAGGVIEAEVDQHLRSASLILLLVSADFLASDYINSVEVRRAMELHNTGKARVIPVIMRPCYWRGTVFGGLKALPGNGEPVTSARWASQDEAFLDIVQGIRDVASTLL